MGVDCRDPREEKSEPPSPQYTPTEFPLLHFSFKMIDQTNQTIIDLNKKYQRNLKDCWGSWGPEAYSGWGCFEALIFRGVSDPVGQGRIQDLSEGGKIF